MFLNYYKKSFMKKNVLLFITLTTFYFMQAQTPEQKLKEKGITLTTPSAPVANYVNAVRVGNLFTCPARADKT
jgi:hypothetical protein